MALKRTVTFSSGDTTYTCDHFGVMSISSGGIGPDKGANWTLNWTCHWAPTQVASFVLFVTVRLVSELTMSGLWMIGADIYRSFGSLEKVDGYKRARGGSSDLIHHTAPDPETPQHPGIVS